MNGTAKRKNQIHCVKMLKSYVVQKEDDNITSMEI